METGVPSVARFRADQPNRDFPPLGSPARPFSVEIRPV
ncbi:Uncharacterised protein [Streptomyces griseus]|nr:hypothetical protein SAMN04490359_1892 [Streptomyces griseus]SQA21008.1 Uncharacterised protein [Streptomyces griseus]